MEKEEQIFITEIKINKVRHLENLTIPLSQTERKHLILTGKNGSGKTSILNEIFYELTTFHRDEINLKFINNYEFDHRFHGEKCRIFIFRVRENSNIKEVNSPTNHHENNFLQFLVNLKFDELNYLSENKNTEANDIKKWFAYLEQTFKNIFEDESIKLYFDRKYKNHFYFTSDFKENFDFLTLSDGFASIINFISRLILITNNNYNQQGIVFIDEIETHLHISLQKKILPFLTRFFPNIQFIVTTHSPFVLQSIKNSIIYDLEYQEVLEDLSLYSSEAIVEAYFDQNKYSENLIEKLNKYEELIKLENLDNKQKIELISIHNFLVNLPKFKAEEIIIKLDELKSKYKSIIKND